MDLVEIGKYIKEQRDKLGLSQNELSEKVHVTRQAVSNWENGKSLPDSDILLSLSELFHVTINDILCAKTIEEATLELVDENNRKTSKMKRVTRFFSLLTISLLIFILAFYFISNYNSIKVYKAYGKSEHFRIVDGIIISTSKNTYFKLGTLESNNNEEIKKIKLYYKKNNKEEIIFESDAVDRLIMDNGGYDEIYRKDFKKFKNNIYLQVTYNDNKTENIKIEIKEEYKNDYLMIIEKGEVIKNSIPTPELQLAMNQESTNHQLSQIIRRDERLPLANNIVVKTKPTQEVVEEVVKVEEPIVTETPIENPPQEEVPIEEPSQEETPVEEPIEININYDEIVDILKTYGEQMFNTYTLTYELEDNKTVSFTYFRNMLTVEIANLEETEKYTICKTQEIIIKYQFMNNYIEINSKDGTVDELKKTNIDIIEKLNNVLSLLYQEKE